MKQTDDRSRRRFLKASSMLGLAVAFSPRSIAELLGGLFQEARQVVIERQMIRMPDVNASDRKASICAERLAPIAAGAVGRPETH